MVELPDMAEVSANLKDDGFATIAICLDVNGSGEIYQEAKDSFEAIFEEKGSSFTVISPDEVLLENVVSQSYAVPYTIFVNSNGIQVGSAFLGPKSKEDWTEIIREKLDLMAKQKAE